MIIIRCIKRKFTWYGVYGPLLQQGMCIGMWEINFVTQLPPLKSIRPRMESTIWSQVNFLPNVEKEYSNSWKIHPQLFVMTDTSWWYFTNTSVLMLWELMINRENKNFWSHSPLEMHLHLSQLILDWRLSHRNLPMDYSPGTFLHKNL